MLRRLVIVGAERPQPSKVSAIARVIDVDDPSHIYFFTGRESSTDILTTAFRRDPSNPSGYATSDTEVIVTTQVTATSKLRMKNLAARGINVRTDLDVPHFDVLSDVEILTWYNRGIAPESDTEEEHPHDAQQVTSHDLLLALAGEQDDGVDNTTSVEDGVSQSVEGSSSPLPAHHGTAEDPSQVAADDVEQTVSRILSDNHPAPDDNALGQAINHDSGVTDNRVASGTTCSDDRHGREQKSGRSRRETSPDTMTTRSLVRRKSTAFIERADSIPGFMRNLTHSERVEHIHEVERQKIMAMVFTGGDASSKGKVIFVTSGKGGTGKTTVSWSLAAALSILSQTSDMVNNVYLIEGDFRSPKLQQKLDIPREKSINNIARKLAVYEDNGETISPREVQNTIVDNIYHDDKYGINYLVCNYGLDDSVDPDKIILAITYAIKLIANRGGTVVVDGGILGEANNSMLDDIIVNRLANNVIVVADASSVAEAHRALAILAGSHGGGVKKSVQKITQQGVRLVLNRADLRSTQVEDFQQYSEPYRVIAALPEIPSLSPYRQKIGTKAFVAYLPTQFQRALVNRMGQSLRWLGYKGSQSVFSGKKPDNTESYNEKTSFWVRMFHKMLRK